MIAQYLGDAILVYFGFRKHRSTRPSPREEPQMLADELIV